MSYPMPRFPDTSSGVNPSFLSWSMLALMPRISVSVFVPPAGITRTHPAIFGASNDSLVSRSASSSNAFNLLDSSSSSPSSFSCSGSIADVPPNCISNVRVCVSKPLRPT